MPGPGDYRPDPTEGIGRVEDLPKPKIRIQSRNYRRRPWGGIPLPGMRCRVGHQLELLSLLPFLPGLSLSLRPWFQLARP